MIAFLVLLGAIAIFMIITMRPGLLIKSKTRHYRTDISLAFKDFKLAEIDFDSLKTGDMVVRTGRSFFSNELRKFSQKEDKYSHCGLISKDKNGKAVIFHSIGGSDNPDSRVRCDSLFWFCNPIEASRFAVFRYQITDSERKAVDSIARDLYRRKIKFDMKFELDENEALYCSEFIYNILINATTLKNFLSLSRLNGKDYIGIDDLYLNNHCKKIFEHEYR